MKQKHLDMLKSAIRHFAITAVALYAAGVTDIKALAFATGAAVVGPAIRGIDKKDPAFGLIADAVTKEIEKLAKISKKKTK
jgi:flagellar biosynthesis component FlhA